jgi:hypothetical protein
VQQHTTHPQHQLHTTSLSAAVAWCTNDVNRRTKVGVRSQKQFNSIVVVCASVLGILNQEVSKPTRPKPSQRESEESCTAVCMH